MTLLLNSSGTAEIIDQGQSAELTFTFDDFQDVLLDKAAIATLTMTLYGPDQKTILNSRNAVNVIDTNGGYLSSEGTLVMKLSAADNTIVQAMVGDIESHWIVFAWSWVDGDGDAQSNAERYELLVRALNDSTLTASIVGWVQ